MINITKRQAPHVSMEAMHCSRRRGPPDNAFPNTHLTACDLQCSGDTAAWHAMFRNLMPSLRARGAAGMGVCTTVL